MRLYSYLRSAEDILSQYHGTVPFAAWLKNYFKQHKKFGSKDRKVISDLCFCSFRVATAFPNQTIEEKLIAGQFLCHEESHFVQELKPDWADKLNAPLQQKLDLLKISDASSFFPFPGELSKEIEPQLFAPAHLIQPDLFLRVRRGKKQAVLQKLKMSGIHFLEEDDCIRLPNGTKIEELIVLDREVVVQDKSSQQVLHPLRETYKEEYFTSWDCCAASGGKTILLHDIYPKASITVSDIRESILHNLGARFKRAGIQQYRSFIADVSSSAFSISEKYNVVICDAPCSGSGTWGRTPEQLIFFPRGKVEYYADLQKAIAINASKALEQGGYFLYITCSVFQKENEEVVEAILQHTPLKLLKQQYLRGYKERADTLYVALFQL